MAFDEYDDEDELQGAEELLESVRQNLADLEERVKRVGDTLDDAAAGIRMELAQNRHEMADIRNTMARLQARFDNQLMALALANIASGVGVAALVLGASRALG